ncbi:winged helix-turn-helix domain-containing protein [Natronorubrum halophilum]|uniref:winged helix-turn-helix domain-containing protein n=1 Tax=Natronorubrum halophilum TaxID=1702106 RepID=UPI00374412DB
MKAADQAILQLLGPPKSLELTPGNIARNTGLSRGYTSNRLGVLVDHDLVEVDEQDGSHPFYSLSDRGEQFLEGELEAADLESDE